MKYDTCFLFIFSFNWKNKLQLKPKQKTAEKKNYQKFRCDKIFEKFDAKRFFFKYSFRRFSEMQNLEPNKQTNKQENIILFLLSDDHDESGVILFLTFSIVRLCRYV